MILNLNDPSSIVAWWKVLPERHGAQLLAFGRLRPQFSSSISTALGRIRVDPEYGAVYALCERADEMEARHQDAREEFDCAMQPEAAMACPPATDDEGPPSSLHRPFPQARSAGV
jgi:hypothetical protein